MPKNEDEIATRLLVALHDFFDRAHPEFKERNFYVFGQSFAGVYIPWLTSKILTEGTIDLKGIGIGNGAIDSPTDWKWRDEFALENGLISAEHRDYIETTMWPACEREIEAVQRGDRSGYVGACGDIFDYIREIATNVNFYEVTSFGMYDYRPLTCLLNNASVKETLGIDEGNSWKLGNVDVLNARAVDAFFPTIPLLKNALSNGIRVLIYHGEKDLIVNHVGAEAWLRDEFGIDSLQNWRVGDRLAGKTQAKGGLDYRLIYDAGHLVPLDQPEVALAMFEEFLSR